MQIQSTTLCPTSGPCVAFTGFNWICEIPNDRVYLFFITLKIRRTFHEMENKTTATTHTQTSSVSLRPSVWTCGGWCGQTITRIITCVLKGSVLITRSTVKEKGHIFWCSPLFSDCSESDVLSWVSLSKIKFQHVLWEILHFRRLNQY